MTLHFGDVEFAVRPNNWRFARPDKTQDRPRRIELDILIGTRDDYDAFVALHSLVQWDRALGFTAWTPRVKAGHGPEVLTVPSSGTGSGSQATYAAAYLVSFTAEGDAGHAGRYHVHAVWELPS